jgi:predicted dehydrogenase
VQQRLRVGVIGCGLIAQVMHLPYLAELDDRFETVALCDVAQDVASACARRFSVPAVFNRWEDLLAGPGLDAVLVLTSGSHAPMALAALQAGLHVFVEKPMALSAAEGAAMVAAAEAADRRLMVGTMKRYDPAVERLVELIGDPSDMRLVRVTTLESPLAPYVAHHPLVRPAAPVAAPGSPEELPGELDDETRWVYRWILLDNLVHELNLLRGVLGEPTAVVRSSLSRSCVGVWLRFGDAECHLSWVDLPGIARYSQELAFYAPERRFTLTLPSPFLRSAPTRLVVEGGVPGSSESFARDEVVSYEEAFKRELVEFGAAIAAGRAPRTSGVDGLRDLELCERIARAGS